MQQKLIVLNMVSLKTRENSDLHSQSLHIARMQRPTARSSRQNSPHSSRREELCEISSERFRRLLDTAPHSSLHRSSILRSNNCSCGRHLRPGDSLVHTVAWRVVGRYNMLVRYFAISASAKFVNATTQFKLREREGKMKYVPVLTNVHICNI